MKNIIEITTVASAQTANDREAINHLSNNAQQVFDYLERLATINNKAKWSLDVSDMAVNIGISSDEVREAINEIYSQHYFMYRRPTDYLFGNSRMVF